jgi:acetyl-CoA carboxylase biotin carboxylase subunit
VGDVYVERYVEQARHVEVQVVGDGTAVAVLGTRECSLQRRRQKLVELAPASSLDTATHDRVVADALRMARAMHLDSLATVELLVLPPRGDGPEVVFMETNARIQVEHTVTEEVFGVDLVREQIRLANGEPLRLPADLRPRGHAIELRINAEDPVTFAPSPGRITALNLPGGLGVRVDTHIYQQYVVPPHYDSLLAKLIVHAENRPAALARLRRALAEFVVEGCKTNLDFHRRLLANADFIAGRMDTRLIERMAPP